MRNDAQDNHAALAQRLMRRQAALSLKIAAVFLVVLVGLPLANLYLPETMASRMGGFTFTWLFLGIAFYPLTCLLSAYFVKQSDRIESEITEEERAR